jgi:hypothetical protein
MSEKVWIKTRSGYMEHDPRAFLFDIRQACDEIDKFTQHISFIEYSRNSMVRAAVERKFLVSRRYPQQNLMRKTADGVLYSPHAFRPLMYAVYRLYRDL